MLYFEMSPIRLQSDNEKEWQRSFFPRPMPGYKKCKGRTPHDQQASVGASGRDYKTVMKKKTASTSDT